MKVIGVTGGVGSGKTALLTAISEKYNCRILFADDIANTLKEPGQCCYEPLVTLLGKEILDENSCIDNAKMASIVFNDCTLLEAVNKIVHPAVYDYILQVIAEERVAGNVDVCFVEAALFIEAGYKVFADSVWYIYVPKDIRITRLQESRGYSLKKISDMMDRQLQEEMFLEACDVVIDNSRSLDETMQQVAEALNAHEIM